VRRHEEDIVMTCTAFGSLLGTDIPSPTLQLGTAATEMGGLVFALLVVAALVILIAGHGRTR
jgi:hypothetical protein